MAPGGEAPAVSVVVATRDRSARLERLLEALARQEGPGPFEVVVVDDGSRDATSDVARAISRRVPYDLKVITSPVSSGPAGARNTGWRAARGRLIAFTDDDCRPDEAWLARIVEGLADADIVVGRTRPPEDQRDRIGPFSNYVDLDHNSSFATCNIGYRREVLESLGGFDQVHFLYPYGEDTDLGFRARKAGFDDRFAEGAVVWHDVHPSSFRNYLRSLRRLDGLVSLVARHPEARGYMNAGLFLRGVDKAVVIAWASAAVVAARPRRPLAWGLAAVAAGLYVWQWDRSRPPARSRGEWVTSVPLAFVADSWSVLVLIRGSLRWKTVLI